MKRTAAVLLFGAILLNIMCGLSSHKIQSLNGVWLFRYDPERRGDEAGYFRPDFPRNDWQKVRIPAFWDDPRYDGLGWYCLNFQIAYSLRKKPLALVFDAVDDYAIIYLNGKKIYEHRGAGIDFYIPVTPYLKPDTENCLVVRIIEDTGGAGGINGKVCLKSYTDECELYRTEYSNSHALPAPQWLDRAVIYEIFPRAFTARGDLKSIIAALPDLEKLGINCLWVMPIFPIGEQNRKGHWGSPYASRDYFLIDPRLGTNHDFQQLVNAAHARGMRVILDIACNHCAWDNRLLKEHPEWFTTDAAGNIITPNDDWADVADFNYSNPALSAYMWSVLEYWVRNFNIDGYRLDVAELVPDDFWMTALKRLQRLKPDVLMLAEGEHPRLHLKGFHLTYAWNTRRTLYRIIKQNASAEQLLMTLEREQYRYPQGARRMRFIENHDEERAVSLFGRQASQTAAVLCFTLPGIPMLYAGQEIGVSIKPSLFEKSTIDWQDRDSGISDFYADLIHLRQNTPALQTGEFLPLKNSQPDALVTFLRYNSDEIIMVVANLKEKPIKAQLELPPNLPINRSWKLLLGDARVRKQGDTLTIKCQAWEWAIFKSD